MGSIISSPPAAAVVEETTTYAPILVEFLAVCTIDDAGQCISAMHDVETVYVHEVHQSDVYVGFIASCNQQYLAQVYAVIKRRVPDAEVETRPGYYAVRQHPNYDLQFTEYYPYDPPPVPNISTHQECTAAVRNLVQRIKTLGEEESTFPEQPRAAHNRFGKIQGLSKYMLTATGIVSTFDASAFKKSGARHVWVLTYPDASLSVDFHRVPWNRVTHAIHILRRNQNPDTGTIRIEAYISTEFAERFTQCAGLMKADLQPYGIALDVVL